MATTQHQTTVPTYDIAAWILAGVALILILLLHLLPALLAGLLVYELVHILAPRLRIVRIHRIQGKLVAVAILALGIALLITLAVVGSIAFFHSEVGNIPALLQHLADIVDTWRTVLPAEVVQYLPEDIDELRDTLAPWLREHAGALQHAGAEVGRTVVHILIGLGIGALVALHDAQPPEALGPLARALQERAGRLGEAFRRVVFAQVRISAVNTILTGLYLVVALPIAGVHLPLAKVASLAFLVVIHKLEYFLNAHIVGTQVHAHAWELLLAMLTLEAAFGLPGVIAAPIYYAYLKDELVSRKLV
jgi:predicted PurR-regulated permease PerM